MSPGQGFKKKKQKKTGKTFFVKNKTRSLQKTNKKEIRLNLHYNTNQN